MTKIKYVTGFTSTVACILSLMNVLRPVISFNVPANMNSPHFPTFASTLTTMHMSNDDFNPDDLAKLRKKRQEILAKKKVTPEAITAAPEPSDILEVAENTDLNALPKLERPSILQSRVAAKVAAEAAAAASSAKNDDKEKKNTQSSPAVGKGIDYLADYEDENELHIPNRIGFSTAAWGDESQGFVPSSNKKLKKKEIAAGKFVPGDLQVAFNTLISGGIRFIEASEAYGITNHAQSLSAETLVGHFTEEYTKSSDTALMGTTFGNPYSLFFASKGKSGIRLGSKSVINALEKSCQRLETSNIELYQVKNVGLLNGYVGGKSALASGLALALERGYCNHVGVCNAGPSTLKGFQRMIEKRGASLSTNQFEFSLTNRKALKNGTIQACKDSCIVPIASNPLDNDLCSGVFTANNPTGGVAGGEIKFNFKKVLEPLIPIHDAQLRVAKKVKERLRKEFREEQDRRSRKYQNPMAGNGDEEITPYQVAINYVVAKGAVPVPVIKNNKEAEELLGCLGWGLNDEEVAILDSAADLCGR